jgi:iron complex outermembrane receptor protein
MRGRYDSDDNGSLDAKLDGLNISPDRIIASWSANWNAELSTFLQANWALSKAFDDAEKTFRAMRWWMLPWVTNCLTVS